MPRKFSPRTLSLPSGEREKHPRFTRRRNSGLHPPLVPGDEPPELEALVPLNVVGPSGCHRIAVVR
jgi:hypothetical protein